MDDGHPLLLAFLLGAVGGAAAYLLCALLG